MHKIHVRYTYTFYKYDQGRGQQAKTMNVVVRMILREERGVWGKREGEGEE